MFPIEVRFDEAYSLIDLDAVQASNVVNGEQLSLKVVQSLSTENYRVTE